MAIGSAYLHVFLERVNARDFHLFARSRQAYLMQVGGLSGSAYGFAAMKGHCSRAFAASA